MKKYVEKIALVVLSLCLALYLHLGLYQTPAGMVDDTQVSMDSSATKMSKVEQMQIVGIKRMIDFSTADQGGAQINGFWQDFFSDSVLQSLVNWSVSQSVIAYYDDFSEDGMSASLTLGFPQRNVSTVNNYLSVALPAGENYILYLPESPTVEELIAVWEQIYSGDRFPSVVIERYAMDSMAQPQDIQVQVRFQ